MQKSIISLVIVQKVEGFWLTSWLLPIPSVWYLVSGEALQLHPVHCHLQLEKLLETALYCCQLYL